MKMKITAMMTRHKDKYGQYTNRSTTPPAGETQQSLTFWKPVKVLSLNKQRSNSSLENMGFTFLDPEKATRQEKWGTVTDHVGQTTQHLVERGWSNCGSSR
jgi:hypothetical protein